MPGWSAATAVSSCAWPKQALNGIEAMDLQSGYVFEQGLTRELSGTPDSAEARAATLERRDPSYPSEL